MRKKYFKIIVVLMVSISMIMAYGCANNKKIGEESSNNTQEVEGKSDSLIKEIDISNKNIIDGSYYIEMQGCFKYPLNIENYTRESSDIVEAEVVEVGYVEVDRIPWTKIDIQITEVIKGSVKVGEKITIYELGGYLTGSSFEELYGQSDNIRINKNDLVEMKYFQMDMHQVGENGIYCIKPRNKDSIFSKETYELVGGSYSVFRYSDDKESYVMRSIDDMEYITKDNLKKSIKVIDDPKHNDGDEDEY